MEISRQNRWLPFVTLALVWSFCGVSHGAKSSSPEVLVIDLGEPGVKFSGMQVTEAICEGESFSMSWLGPQSEDAFFVIDASGLEEKGWTLENPKTGIRVKGHVIFSTATALREPSEKKRKYQSIGGMMVTLDVNKDKKIDASDIVYDFLSLFVDYNGDGKIDPDELTSLRSAEIKELRLRFKPSKKKDTFGNSYKQIKILMSDGSATTGSLVKLRKR